MTKYKAMVLGSGRELGLVMLGRLHNLYRQGLIQDVDKYSGCSVGAIICVFLCMGYEPSEIRNIAIDMKLIDIEHIDLKNIIKNMGLQKHSLISGVISEYMIEKYGTVVTLKQLYDITHKTLYICTTNLTKQKTEYISYISHPHLSVVKALEMSFSIPTVFEKCEWRESLYVDGAITDPLPTEPFHDIEQAVLVMYVTRKFNIDASNILSYMKAIHHVMEKKLIDNSLSKCKNNFTREELHINDDSLLVDVKKKIWFYEHGKTLKL